MTDDVESTTPTETKSFLSIVLKYIAEKMEPCPELASATIEYISTTGEVKFHKWNDMKAEQILPEFFHSRFECDVMH